MISRAIITILILMSVITLSVGSFYVVSMSMDHSHSSQSSQSSACALQVFARERCPGADLVSMALKHASHHIQTIRSIFSASSGSSAMLLAMTLALAALMLRFFRRGAGNAAFAGGWIAPALSHEALSIRYWSHKRFFHWMARETDLY